MLPHSESDRRVLTGLAGKQGEWADGHQWEWISERVCVWQLASSAANNSWQEFYQELLKENSNPRLKGNRKGIIVKDKEFYIPIINTFPTR